MVQSMSLSFQRRTVLVLETVGIVARVLVQMIVEEAVLVPVKVGARILVIQLVKVALAGSTLFTATV